MMKFS